MSTDVYRAFIGALNDHDLDRASRCVDLERYQENCVGFTPGFVGWEQAAASLKAVWSGIPDLRVELLQVGADAATVLARGIASGTNSSPLYGVPATRRAYRVVFFDSCEIDGDLIVRRVQHADVIGQMRQLYGRALGVAGLASSLWRVDPGATV